MFSAIPPQYVGTSTPFHHDNSGDVVIVVPPIHSNTDSMAVPQVPDHSIICIDTEADVEPTSPKTMTESSSKLFVYLLTLQITTVNIVNLIHHSE